MLLCFAVCLMAKGHIYYYFVTEPYHKKNNICSRLCHKGQKAPHGIVCYVFSLVYCECKIK